MRSIFTVLFSFSFMSAIGQGNPAELTLDRIHNTSDFSNERFGPARWIEDGESYTTIETTGPGAASEIISYETKTGNRSVLVAAERLIPQGTTEPLSLDNYYWSHNKDLLLIYTNSKRVWRQNTRGDYWVLNLKTGKLQQLGIGLPESSLMFAKFSPGDDRVAYVSKHNIYVEDIQTGRMTQLTSDGNEKIINGTFDWAYEEEFGARDGFRWSPNGENISYWQLDASEIRDFFMINNTDSTYSFTVPVQYPKVGEDPSSCKIGIIASSGGETTWISVPGSSIQNYLPRMKWSPDSKHVWMQQLNRKQNTNKLWRYSIADGAIEHVYTDQDEAWVSVVNDWIWFNEGKEFSWLSEKDGWRHFYRVNSSTGTETLVTTEGFDAMSIAEIDEASGYVYYMASPANATQMYLYRKKLNGKGAAERLTPENQPGTHRYQISPGGDYAFHTFANINTPPIIDLVQLPSHKPIRILASNEKMMNNLNGILRSPIEFFKVTTEDNIELDGWMIKPPNFDQNKEYPLFLYVYGEPAGQTTRDNWSGRTMWYYYLAQQGYIIVSLDNRGTPAPKGRDWRKSIYRKIGVINSNDLAKGTKEVLKWDFIDEERVGVWGWSGGGSMTLNLLFRYPETFKVGMSVAPVGNQLMYDNIYQERYMGVPWENMEDFVEGSPVTYAKNLKGDLLLIHGTGDDNVHYQNAELVMNELIKHDKQFQMMSYPNRSHGIFEGENTRRHLFKLMTKFLNEHLEPGGKESTRIETR